MNELEKPAAQQPEVVIPLVGLVQGYIEARDRIKQFDEEYDKQVVPPAEVVRFLNPWRRHGSAPGAALRG